MKRVVASLGLLLLCTGAVDAREYQSSFGFAASIPDDWVVLTKQAVKDNPALLDASGSQLAGMSPERFKELIAKVEKGSLEMKNAPCRRRALRDGRVFIELGGVFVHSDHPSAAYLYEERLTDPREPD